MHPTAPNWLLSQSSLHLDPGDLRVTRLPAIAAMFSEGWTGAVVIGWAIGLVACLIGLLASFFLNLPYGPTLVLSMGLFFLGAILARSIRSQTS